MRLILTMAIIVALSDKAICCKCIFRDLKTDLRLSEKIFVGQLIGINNNVEVIKVLKVWKGEVPTGNLIIMPGRESGCHRRILFPINEYFIIFLEADGIHNCSRTIEYEKSTDIKVLDSIFSKTLWVNETEKTTLATLDYTRQYIVQTDKGRIDIKGKKVVFNFEGRLMYREELPLGLNEFYQVRYFLVAAKDSIQNNPCGVDFIFYVNQVHESMILLEERRKKIEKKSIRLACRRERRSAGAK